MIMLLWLKMYLFTLQTFMIFKNYTFIISFYKQQSIFAFDP